LETGAV
jgi:hypothetical protein